MDQTISSSSKNFIFEIYAELERFVEKNLSFLLPVEKCWQPADLLPNMTSSDWLDELIAFRKEASNIPDDVLVTLVANMITEEALPSYHAWLTRLGPGIDTSGTEQSSLARWMRGWVAEEKRHGDALAGYLYLIGRVNCRAIETTIQNLLRNGFDPMTENCIFQGFIYTSFQERATYISHTGVAKAARLYEDKNLARICDYVAGDEVRHEKAYERFVSHLFEIEPDQSMIAMAKMLRKTIVMPSRHMTDGHDHDLFNLFSTITQQNGIYTVTDYAKIMNHLVRLWKIDTVSLNTPEGREAQDYVAKLPERYFRLAERSAARPANVPARPISWIYDRIIQSPPSLDTPKAS